MDSREAFAKQVRPLRLDCGVQRYDWGQRDASAFIPRLLGVPPDPGKPYAELWIGAHPVQPSQARIDGGLVSLPELIASAPEATLGSCCVQKFGPRLPFLLKVLAAERMLSIQTHPDKRQAEEGFAREEAEGVPRTADHRNYRDDNHKPELIVALTDFHALCGFRPLDESRAVFRSHESLAPLLDAAGGEAATVESLFTACMSRPVAEVDAALAGLVTVLKGANATRPFTPYEHEHWLLRADRQFSRSGHHDRGLLAMLMLNLVRLAPREALFLGPGELHSYLEGVGVELMANSDNVLRGGLTSKHVDVSELRRVLKFRSGPARTIRPTAAGVYETPAEEFELTSIELVSRGRWIRPASLPAPDVWLVLSGAAVLHAVGEDMEIGPGAAVFVPAAVGDYEIHATKSARLVRATVNVRL